MTEWFADWFGHTYLDLYPHRDDEDARRAVALIAANTPLAGARVLDLACGQGRHAVQLNGMGGRTVGVDLSAVLLRKARYGSPTVRDLVRADMRCLPFRRGTFDIVVNLFTSFGYFGTDQEHRCVLGSVADLLVSGGWFVIDFLNADQVRNGLIPSERVNLSGRTVEVMRRLVDRGAYVQKEMHVLEEGARHVERVRLFSAHELSDMLTNVGVTVLRQFGDYEGSPLLPSSPRAILFARKP